MAHKLDFEDVFRVYTTSSWDLLREVYILKLVILEMICLRVCVTHGIDFEDVFRVYMTSQWDISREVNHLRTQDFDFGDVFRVYMTSRWDI